ncbi:DUF167 family protein YggU [Vibrio sp. SS-MA-C1-2]|uniref:DUF167 family protein YggU n=1 Tax=Vibrio sp. SS-MA-C1-2 TaxID=2908646 RepID=UPI001F336B11|nr:DUF167 family protein YggU [Vibrio sp. SS-MA-C1-2]UJF19067.1 DUF167 family protein YggU [Vibrio sp. SS-MA-C1-2]
MSAVTRNHHDLILRLYIQPKASRDKIVGLHNNEIKVAITAPPIDGKANSHLTKFLAKQFKVAKSKLVIEKGELGRHKQIRVIDPPRIPPEIAAYISE